MGNLNDYTMIEKQYLEPNDGFSQTVVVQSATYKTIYISGQIGLGTTLEAQTTAASKETQLLNCNATFRDVVKMNTYIVHFNPETDYQFFR
jgi:enamine deaminase RidA (YjgF/YER057c/UK114 family)